MAKGKNKLVKSMRLSCLDGAREVDFGRAPAEQRQRRDFSKTGSASKPDETSYADKEARERRWGSSF